MPLADLRESRRLIEAYESNLRLNPARCGVGKKNTENKEMKTKFLLAGMLILFSWSTNLYAQTYVSGLISANTTWTLTGSPYIVTGNILVDNGVILTINAGVTVKFDSLMALQVDGELIARGDSSNKITFTSNQSTPIPGNWGFILFSNTSIDAAFDIAGNYTSGSILEYCVIGYAGGGNSTQGAVVMDDARPFINFSIIQNSARSGIHASNLMGSLKITNNDISDNFSGGLRISGGSAIISGNSIHHNYSADYGGGGIFTIYNTSEILNNSITNNIAYGYSAGGGGGGIYIREGTSTISKNIIRKNSLIDTLAGEGGGILIYYNCIATISNNDITNNKAGYGGGIYSIEGTSAIFNNIISDNTASISGGIYGDANNISNNAIIRNSAQNGSAIFTAYNAISGNYTYNTFVGNKSTGTDPVSTINISSLPLFNYNNIFNNTASYELYNGNASTSAHLDAGNNWWGISSDPQIQEKIYDWFDDASLGIADFSPFSTIIRTDAPISPPAGLNIVASTGQIRLNWSANTEPDIAGYKVYWGTTNDYPYTNSVDVGNVTSYSITGLPAGTCFANITAYDISADTVADDKNTLVNEKQCAGNESWYARPVSSVGINDPEQNSKNISFNLYPNPASDIVTLDNNKARNGGLTLKFYNVIGTLVKSEILQQNNRQINIGDLGNGIYMVEIKSNEGSGKHKLIIRR